MHSRSSGSKPILGLHMETCSYRSSLDSGNAALFEKPPEEFLEHNTEGIDWERVASAVAVSPPSNAGVWSEMICLS